MKQKSGGKGRKSDADARQERLKAALKANMRRRKDRAKALAAQEPKKD